jgi:two-component system, NarL family, response regulator LiaR
VSERDSAQGRESVLVRVGVVDDHGVFRRGLRDLLEERGLEVVGEASSGEEAIELAVEEIPDVVLMDISMPGMSGVEATRRIRAETPHTRVVMLTVSAAEDDVNEAILAGASGYLLKHGPVDAIVPGVTAAARGEALLSPTIAARLLERMRAGEGPSLPLETMPHLTDREVEVLRLMAAGKGNSEIAAALCTSPHTVKTHVSNILAKLEVENRIQAAVYAVQRRLV